METLLPTRPEITAGKPGSPRPGPREPGTITPPEPSPGPPPDGEPERTPGPDPTDLPAPDPHNPPIVDPTRPPGRKTDAAIEQLLRQSILGVSLPHAVNAHECLP